MAKESAMGSPAYVVGEGAAVEGLCRAMRSLAVGVRLGYMSLFLAKAFARRSLYYLYLSVKPSRKMTTLSASMQSS